MRAQYDCNKMYTFMRGYCIGANLMESQKALTFARKMHQTQYRKDGQPYLSHPLTMACNAASLGINDDNIIATILLHDILEDINIVKSDLPVNDTIKNAVEHMTFKYEIGQNKEKEKELYYKKMIESKEATICKMFDRCHNVSSMAGVFNEEKLGEYIDETRRYVLPLLRNAKELYPEYSSLFHVLKYHIVSVIDSIEATLNAKR